MINIRQAIDSDREIFIDFTVKLSKFNRSNHNNVNKYDDYESVLNSISSKALETFQKRSKGTTLILIAELHGQPVGYALGRIFQEAETTDNGTGIMGLFDELYVDETARGLGLGEKLFREVMEWMQSKGIHRVKLYAYSWNTQAKRLYEKNGFTEYAISYEKFI